MEDKKIENEKFNSDYPFEINIEKTKTILNQLKKSVCKIYGQNENGSGFFCKIPLGNAHFLNALVTCYHVLSEKDLVPGKNITFSFFDEKYLK